MGSQNFETFKPLSEEEEKHVVGGGTNNSQGQNSQCSAILTQFKAVETEISILSQQGQPVPVNLQMQAANLQLQYQECQNQAPAPGN